MSAMERENGSFMETPSIAGNLPAALQSCDDQVDQMEPKLRILEVELFEPVIIDYCGLNTRLATQCHHPSAVRRKKTYFAEQGAFPNVSPVSTSSTSPDTI